MMNKMTMIISISALMAASLNAYAEDKRFSKWDKNSDGKVTVEEYSQKSKNKQKAENKFKRFDLDKNGSLSPEEVAEIPARKKKN